MAPSPRSPPSLPNPPSQSSPRWLLATLALLSLTGCFDMLEEIWLKPDGSARVVMDVALPKSLMDLAKVGGQDPVTELREKARAAEARLKQDPDITHFELRTFEEAGQLHLVYDLTVKDATKLARLQEQAMEEASRDGRAQPGGRWNFRIERKGGGEYLFVQGFDPDAAAEADEADDDPRRAAKAIGQQMAKAMLANNHITVRVHGEGIGETNGTVNAEKNAVEWKLSLAELMDPASPTRELRAVVYAGAPLWLWPVVIGVPLAVLGLAIASARRKRARYSAT